MSDDTKTPTPRRFSRKEIGLRQPSRRLIKLSRSQGVFIHHSAGRHSSNAENGKAIVQRIQGIHMKKGWSDIGYSWLVDDAGNIFEGRGWGMAGSHTKGKNREAHGLCYLGNTQKQAPTPAALRALRELIEEHHRLYPTGQQYVKPHSAVSRTACPGKHLRHWLTHGRAEQLLAEGELVLEGEELRLELELLALPQSPADDDEDQSGDFDTHADEDELLDSASPTPAFIG